MHLFILQLNVNNSSNGSFVFQKSEEETIAKEEERKLLIKEHKKTEREHFKKGKKPFYMKKCK